MKTHSARSNSTQFLALRKRLDSLGYTDLPLGLDSAPLAAAMVEDIIATTESLRELETDLDKKSSDLNLMNAQIEPLQDEITRLTRENTQLHQWLIKAKEDQVHMENDNQVNTFELQSENRRLKLVNQKANDQVKNLEKQLEATTIKLRDALEAPSVTNMSDFDRESRRNRRSTRSRRNGSSSISFDNMSVNSGANEEDVKGFKSEIEKLKEELNDLKSQLQTSNYKLSETQDILKLRDDEILRLSEELQKETGKNGYIITLRHKYAQQEVEIEKLRAQLRVTNPGISRLRRMARTAPRVLVSLESIDPEPSSEEGSSIHAAAEKSINEDPQQHEEEEEVFIEEQNQNLPRFQPAVEMDYKDYINNEEQAKKIEKLKEKLSNAKQQIKDLKKQMRDNQIKTDELNQQIVSRDRVIALMATDFAYVKDAIESITSEKDALINELTEAKKAAESKGSNINEEKMKQILRGVNDQHQEEINQKDREISQLNDRISELSKPKPKEPCKECADLRAQLEIAKKQLASIEKDNADVAQIKAEKAQLEMLLQSAAADNSAHSADAERVVILQSQLTASEAENEELKLLISRRESELTQVRKLLEESEKLSNSVPDIQQRARVAVEKINAEKTALVSELKEKTLNFQQLNDKYIESQRTVASLQKELQQTRDDAAQRRDEARFHRAKNEEVQAICAEKLKKMQMEYIPQINTLKTKLHEQILENKTLSDLLQTERSKLAPLQEVEVPKLNQEILDLKRERSELASRVNSLMQLSKYVEQTTEFSPNTVKFISELHQFNDRLRPFMTF